MDPRDVNEHFNSKIDLLTTELRLEKEKVEKLKSILDKAIEKGWFDNLKNRYLDIKSEL
jgi:hypothetical protein